MTNVVYGVSRVAMTDGMPLGPDTVTVHRTGTPTGTDPYGNPLPASDSTHDIAGCNLQPMSGSVSENNAPDAVTISIGYRLFAPYGSDINDTDWFVFGGVTYDIEGGVMSYEAQDGFDGHIELYLHRNGG